MKYKTRLEALEKQAARVNITSPYILVYGRDIAPPALSPGQCVIFLDEQDRDL